jgi:tetratricopeptide (TPR) repeat protein
VIARLIDTADGSQLWSERFDRQLDDVFAVQDEIAQAVARALGVRVSKGRSATTALTSYAGSRDLEAYMMCLKGRHCWNQRTESALQRAAEYFQSAVELDPTYAEAFSGLAEVQTTLGLYGVLKPEEIMPRAKSSATRALAIGGGLSAPYAVLGCLASVYEREWPDAENHYRRAIEVNPDHPAAHHWYAINYLVPLKRFAEASESLRRAAAADPLSMPIGVSVGLLSYFAHRFSQADRELRESLALDAGSGTARLFLGLTLAEMARHDEAIRELETALQLSPSPEMRAALAYAFARAGQHDRARQELAGLHRIAGERYVSPSLVAQVYAGLGETTPALDWLERARDVRASELAWLSVRPVFDTLRSEPRFGAVVATLGL